MPKLDPVMVISEPTLGIDAGKTLKISGGGYEKAEYIHAVRSKIVTDTLRATPEPGMRSQSKCVQDCQRVVAQAVEPMRTMGSELIKPNAEPIMLITPTPAT